MTEEEAKTKWCPFVRLAKAHGSEVPHGQAVINRVDLGNNEYGLPIAACCIGSSCMAWRERWIEIDAGPLPPLPTLGLRPPILNALQREGITTTEALVARSETDILRIPNLWKRALADIEAALAKRGLALNSTYARHAKIPGGYCGLSGALQ